jgi:hypothetical protein
VWIFVAGFVFATLVLATTACGGSRGTPPVQIRVGAGAARVLDGRVLAVSIGTTSDLAGTSGDRDIWVLARSRLLSVSGPARQLANNTASAQGYGTRYSFAGSFSLAPDGSHLAFLIEAPAIPGGPTPRLIVSRADGSGARDVGALLRICELCAFSVPSWDRDSRSFVISVEAGGSAVSRIFRLGISDGPPTMLTPRRSKYSEYEPVVSPNGEQIAFLRSAAPGSGPFSGRSFVYVMRADGDRRGRLPLPARNYTDLWWCGGSAKLCTDVASQNDYCPYQEGLCPDAASRETFQIGVEGGRVTQKHHWIGGSYRALSPDARFAITSRKAPRGWELLGGPVNAGGSARLAVLLVAPAAKSNPFHDFSVSGG